MKQVVAGLKLGDFLSININGENEGAALDPHSNASTGRRSGSSFRVNPVEESPDHLHQYSTYVDERSLEMDLRDESVVVCSTTGRKEVKEPIITNVDVEPWLPITESRDGSVWFAIFHLLNSGIGVYALALPVAFNTLGWVWGITCLITLFAWQLYTTWLLVNLHQYSPTGARYSRYIQLAIAAFGPTVGKILALFPVLYLSTGTCVLLTLSGGLYMKHFYQTLCNNGRHCDPTHLSTIQWILIFVVLALLIAQLVPNLNSIAWLSLVGALTAITYCTFIWLLPIIKGRPKGVSHTPTTSGYDSDAAGPIITAIGIISFSFRGHNLVLEIQGTLPPSKAVQKKMWRGVTVAYTVIGVCFLALTIGGYWAYASQIPSTGLLTAFTEFHDHSRAELASLYLILIINSLCQFQIYAIVVFDNLEIRYVAIKGKPAAKGLARTLIRLFIGCLVFFLSITFPFLPKLGSLIGGIALPLTFVYPCFMWIVLKKPRKFSTMFWINWILGCSGIVLSVLIIVSAIWKLVIHGLYANFFHPR